jgi:hypothetical protein
MPDDNYDGNYDANDDDTLGFFLVAAVFAGKGIGWLFSDDGQRNDRDHRVHV